MQQLARGLRFQDLLILGLLFIGPAAAVNLFGVLDAASHGKVGLVYLVATVVMGFTAYSYSQMSQAIPKAGAVYAYASAGINPQVGFMVGWIILLDYLFIPAVAYLFTGISLNVIFPSVPVWIWTLAAVLVTTTLNLLGVRRSAKITMTILIIELIVLFMVLIAGAILLFQEGATRPLLSPFVGMADFQWSAIFNAVSIAVLSYLGFDAIATFAEENAGKKELIGKATLACLIVAGLLFVLQTYVAALLSPFTPEHLQQNPAMQGKAYYMIVNERLGEWLGVSLALMKAVGAAFAAMVGQAASSRLIFSMARDNRLPKVLSQVGENSGVPTRALLAAAGFNLLLAVAAANHSQGLKHLVSFVDVGALSAFIMLHLSVIGYFWFKLGQRGALNSIKYLLIPIIGILLLLPVLFHIQLSAQVVGVIWLAIGGIVMWVGRAIARY